MRYVMANKDSIIAYLNELPPERIVAIAGNLSGKGMVKAAGAQPYIVFRLKGRGPVEAMKDMIEVLSKSNK